VDISHVLGSKKTRASQHFWNKTSLFPVFVHLNPPCFEGPRSKKPAKTGPRTSTRTASCSEAPLRQIDVWRWTTNPRAPRPGLPGTGCGATDRLGDWSKHGRNQSGLTIVNIYRYIMIYIYILVGGFKHEFYFP
jgi:hypothetical protein